MNPKTKAKKPAVSVEPHTFEPSTTPSVDRVAVRAHQLWEMAGTPEGRDLEFWLQAEQEVRGSAAPFETARAETTEASGTEADIEALQSPNGIPFPGKAETSDELIDTPETGGQTGRQGATSL